MLLVISSFLLQYSYGVRDANWQGKSCFQGNAKENTSVCKTLYRVYQSFFILVIDSFSRHLFDDFCKRHNVHRKLIGTEVGPYTGNNGGLNNSHTRRVKCQVYHFSTSSLKLFTSFSYFKLRSLCRDRIKTLKEKCFNSKIFRRVHDQMVEIAMMFLLKVKLRTLTDWEESCDYNKLPMVKQRINSEV